MSVIANFMMVDDTTLDAMVEFTDDELLVKIDELEELGENELYCMDKLWDGLHFLLTGVTAGSPIEGNHLSEAIVGVHMFDTDEDYFVSCLEYDELPDIINSLKKVDVNKLKENFNPSALKKAKIYPNIWGKNDKETLLQELLAVLNEVLAFYEKAEQMKQHIIISIF